MRTKLIAAALVAAIGVAVVVAVAVLATGGDGGQMAIRTQRGLGLASAMAPGAGGGKLTIESPATGVLQSGAPVGVGGDASAAAGSRVAYPATGAGFLGAPQLAPAPGGITVQGYGSASAPADSAVVEFNFTRSGYLDGSKPVPLPEPVPGEEPGTESPVATPAPAQAITEETLKPVIDALVAAGVPRSDIELVGQYYSDPYASATLRAKVGDVGSLDGIVQAARDAAGGLGDGLTLGWTGVSYTVKDCLALEKEAMKAAAADASERAGAFAEALGAGLGDLVAASHWSWSPYGGTCGQDYFGMPYPVAGTNYAAGQPQEVQVVANISATYAIR